jgi:hypothetical protein
MSGFPPIVADAGRWNRLVVRNTLILFAVGIFCGTLVTYARQPFHLPGHKVIWWLPLILASRLRTGLRWGVMLGTLSTICTTTLFGGRMPGGDFVMPIAVVSAIWLDLCVDWLERAGMRFGGTVLALALAGMVGNLLCTISRAGGLFSLYSGGHAAAGIGFFTSFAICGMVAGTLGGVLGAVNTPAR